jgi:hypothetical protein
MFFTSAANESSPSFERETATTSAPKLASRLASSRPIPVTFRINVSSRIIKNLIYPVVSLSVTSRCTATLADSCRLTTLLCII